METNVRRRLFLAEGRSQPAVRRWNHTGRDVLLRCCCAASMALGGLSGSWGLAESMAAPVAPREAMAASGPQGASSTNDGTQIQRRDVPPLFGGIQVNEPDHTRWVRAVAAARLDSVQVTLYARQGDWDSAELWFDPERDATSVVAEIRAARREGLRAVLVMRVALEHALPRNRHLWHGMVWPRGELVDAWFARYREFLLWGASIAEREGVDLLAIGNELSSMTSTSVIEEIPDLYAYWLDPVRTRYVRERLVACAEAVEARGEGEDLRWLDGGRHADLESMLRERESAQRAWAENITGGPGLLPEARIRHLVERRHRYEDAWRSLVADAREVYSGPLTYGANFDQFEEVSFWDSLDAVGVNAYFPLSLDGLSSPARRERMAISWAQVAGRLSAVAVTGPASPPLPVVLLELGWTRKAGSTVRPYSYDRVEVLERAVDPDDPESEERLECVHWSSRPDDPSERADALAALGQVVRDGGFDALRSFTLWKLSTDTRHREIEPFVVVFGEDGEFLAIAARIADEVRHRTPGCDGA